MKYSYDHIVPTFLNTAAVTSGGLNYDQKQLKTKRLLARRASMRASTLAFYSNAELDVLHILPLVPGIKFGWPCGHHRRVCSMSSSRWEGGVNLFMKALRRRLAELRSVAGRAAVGNVE